LCADLAHLLLATVYSLFTQVQLCRRNATREGVCGIWVLCVRRWGWGSRCACHFSPNQHETRKMRTPTPLPFCHQLIPSTPLLMVLFLNPLEMAPCRLAPVCACVATLGAAPTAFAATLTAPWINCGNEGAQGAGREPRPRPKRTRTVPGGSPSRWQEGRAMGAEGVRGSGITQEQVAYREHSARGRRRRLAVHVRVLARVVPQVVWIRDLPKRGRRALPAHELAPLVLRVGRAAKQQQGKHHRCAPRAPCAAGASKPGCQQARRYFRLWCFSVFPAQFVRWIPLAAPQPIARRERTANGGHGGRRAGQPDRAGPALHAGNLAYLGTPSRADSGQRAAAHTTHTLRRAAGAHRARRACGGTADGRVCAP